LRAVAELARSLLLQRRGGEGRRGVAPPLLAVDAEDGELAAGGLLERAHGLAGCALAREAELLDFAAPILHELRRELLLRVHELGIDGPILPRLEGGDLVLALADHAQRRALHASGGEIGADLFPQERRQVEAHEEIEGAPRLLRVHEINRDPARMLHGLAYRVLGDLVEHHALHVLALQGALLLQELLQVPGDRLALAVGVGRQIQRFRFLEGPGDGIDVLAVALDGLVLHGEVVLRIHGAFFRHQVPNVAVGSQHLEVLAEVLLDGLRLGRRLHDNEIGAQNSVLGSSNAGRLSALRTPGPPSAHMQTPDRAD